MMKCLTPMFLFFSLGKRRMELGDFPYMSIDIPSASEIIAKITKTGKNNCNEQVLSVMPSFSPELLVKEFV